LPISESNAQNFFTIKGQVLDSLQNPVSKSVIRVQNSAQGTQSDANGNFKIRLIEGVNRLIFSHLGYKSLTVDLKVERDTSYRFMLLEDRFQLNEVYISAKKKDPAYEIIKKTIDTKNKYLSQYQNFSSEIYLVGSQGTKSKVKSKYDSIPDSIKDTGPGFYECRLKRYENKAGKFKEEKEAVRKLGNIKGIYFMSLSDGEVNLYKNLFLSPKIGDIQIMSPLHDLAITIYKFQLLQSYYDESKKKVYQIRVSPRDLGNATYTGVIEIWDEDFALKSVDLNISKRGMIVYDAFRLVYEYKWFENIVMLSKAQYYYKSGKTEGKTELVQTNFKFNQDLPKNFFGNELGRTLDDAYLKDSTYWKTTRSLKIDSISAARFIRLDAEKQKKESKAYLDSLDRETNRITFLRIVWRGVNHINRSRKTFWEFGSLPNLVNFPIGGASYGYGLGHQKTLKNRQNYGLNASLRYQPLNNQIYHFASFRYRYNPVKNARISFNAYRGVNTVNNAATISDFLSRTNFYLGNSFSVSHRIELLNGLFLNNTFEKSNRNGIQDFKFTKAGNEIFSTSRPQPIAESNKSSFKIGLDYTPYQKYLREPNEKIILGSKWPIFFVDLEWAQPLLKRDKIKFIYLKAGLQQQVALGLFGNLEYRYTSGNFLSKSVLSEMDNIFLRGGDRWFFSPAMVTFQLIPKTRVANELIHEFHIDHQFNGALTSKIPFFNKTNIKEMVGGGFVSIPGQKYNYAEFYSGLNRTFKIGRGFLRLGAYYVLSQSSDVGFRSGFKFGISPYNPDRNTWSF
jgi:hypothetical protein